MRLLLAALFGVAGLAVAQPALADGGFDPGRAAQSLCSTPLGARLGADCVAKLTALISACKAQSSAGDAWKLCVTSAVRSGERNSGDTKRPAPGDRTPRTESKPLPKRT